MRKFLLVCSLLLAGLLTACDSTSKPYDAILRVVVIDRVPYLYGVQRMSFGIGMTDQEIPEYFTQPDVGWAWQVIDSPPEEVAQAVTQPVEIPRTACLAGIPLRCYRITRQARIEYSPDDGRHWQVVWQMPPGREPFMQDYIQRKFYLERVTPDMVPYDLAIVEQADGDRVIAAYGNQGILVRYPDGTWVREAVALARPVPERAQSFAEAIDAVFRETCCTGIIGVFLLACLIMAKIIYPRKRVPLALPFFLFPALWLPFVLWAYGVISFYKISLILAISVSMALILLAILPILPRAH